MKKNLLTTLLSLFVLFGIYTETAHAQGTTTPAATCGYTAVAPEVVSLCSDAPFAMPADPGTGAPNYAYLISSVPDTVIIGIVEAGDTFDATALGLAEGDNVYVTGFGYNEANILSIITSVGGSPLCSFVLDPAVCAALAAITDADLNTLLDLAATFGDGGPVTVNTLLGLIGTVEGLGGVLGAPAPCYAIFDLVDYEATLAPCGSGCAASVGTVVPPATTFACNDGSNAAELEVAIPGDSNTTDYLFIVTGTAVDSLGNPVIDGVTYDGIYDFTGYDDGDYCYWGFAYNQTELDALAASLNGFLPLLSLPTIPIPADLGVIFDTFGGLLGDISIPGILGFLDNPPIPIPLPELCYAVSTDPVYCITVGTCSLPCAADGGVLSTEDATTFCNNDATEDFVSISTTGGEGGEQLITITYDATKGTTGLVGSDKVYMHSGAGFSGPGSAWESVIGNWGQDDGVGEMTNIGENLWQITVDAEYYGLAPGTTIYGIGMVFRNAAGNLEGKDYNNQDIFVREINTGSPLVLQADGAEFDGVFADLGSTMNYEYIVTDMDGNVLAGPDPANIFDFNGAPAGMYYIYGLAYEGTIAVGATIAEISGDCFDLSDNIIMVTVEECVFCEANFGTPFTTGETTVCPGTTFSGVCTDGNNTNPDYATALVVTVGPELNILGLLAVCEEFQIPADNIPGVYTLHVINYALADEQTILDAIDAGATGVDVANLIADGTICAALDVTGISITSLDPASPECAGYPPLTVSDASTTIGGTQYVVVFSVLSGSGDYTVGPGGIFDGTTFVSDPVNCGTDALFTVTDNLSGESVVVSVIAPCGVEVCDASYGTVTAPANTFVCAGGTSEAVTVEGAATEGYNTLFVITSGPELTIQGLSASGAVDFSGYPAGTYTVHAFNYSLDDEATILAAVEFGVTTGVDVAGLIADGVICADLDVAGVQFTVSEPIEIFINPTCDQTVGAVDLEVTVVGGFPDLLNGYTIGGTLFGTNTAEQGNPFVIPGIADADAYTIIITDALGCSAILEGVANCTKCPDDVLGNMPEDLVIVPVGDLAVAVLDSYTLSDTSFVGYALHTNPAISPAEILAESTDGSFSLSDFDGDYNTIYYISALVGVADANGNGVPDISHPCTQESATSTPVVFLAPIVINLGAPNCDNTTGLTTYAFSITGGYPGFDPAATYTLTGEINASGENYAGVSYLTPPIGDATTWFLTATDDYGNSATVSETTDCEKGNYVSWLSFTGKVQDNGNLLQWATASEVDNDYFMLERSADGNTFTEIYRADGAGTTTVAQNYQFLDQTAPAGISYYRVTQVDFSGQSSSTEVISLTRNRIEFGIGSVVPVPATDFVQLTVNAVQTKAITVEIYDMAGKFMGAQQVDAHDGVNTVTINVSNFAAGMYFVSVTDGISVATERIVKE